MFSHTYSSAMRNGSRILFWMAILMFVAGLIQGSRVLGFVNLQPLGPNNEPQWGWLELAGMVLGALTYAVAPLIGAMVIDRADHWLAQIDQNSN